ncbi:MAG: NAD+ synthase, partial [Gammaproteobacteria bacterium]|nr:NAD+ synthase [Gammaproteobacteria bacterium]
DRIYNACAVFSDGKQLCNYRKHLLPNYSVFDEERYFSAGKHAAVFRLNGIALGLLICEDVWQPGPFASARTAGAECAIVINGSPYAINCQDKRERTVAARIAESKIPVVYLNMIGGQDELVFDGGSFVMDVEGNIRFRAPPFIEGLQKITLSGGAGGVEIVPGDVAVPLPIVESVYRALLTGTRDYVDKHGFPGVIIGLSGGIDSALVLAIACDALGAERVRTVMMPFRYTTTMSQEDAAKQASELGVRYDVVPIAPMYDATVGQLESIFAGQKEDVTEENIQARCRGLLLMAISNKTGWMLLTTGNKSEMAVGYATLYGDMAGGFAPIKDCSKTLVYRLARYRNSLGAVIPERVITRPPSAELRPGQRDSDSLPDYDILDPILEAFIEKDLSVEQIVSQGFERDTVIRVLEMVKRNEYKRRQAPPGVRISSRAFGRDWRYPITSGYRFPE